MGRTKVTKHEIKKNDLLEMQSIAKSLIDDLKSLSEKAVWSTAFVNDLPDSSFLYIRPGGEKDDEGKTVPRSLRMFPYKDANGAVDLPHLRNAIARIPQSNLGDDLKERLQSRARTLLERETQQTERSEKSAIADDWSWANSSDLSAEIAKRTR